MHLRIARLPVAVLVATLAVAACGSGGGSHDPGGSHDGAGTPVVVTFEVVGGERFRALLTDPADIAIAHTLFAGEDAPSIPNGRVVRGETGVNEGYTWSLDPADFEFADVTMEVCDGVPSDVEQGVMTSERYCPWSAIVVALDPAS